MCGRFGLSATPEALADFLELDPEEVPRFSPRFNVAPGQQALVVRPRRDGRMAVRPVRWGLVPAHSAARPGRPLVNARVESAATRPAFRDAMARRRCLVPADGFFEWQGRRGEGRRPWHVGLRGGALFAMGGLWERWRDPSGGDTLDTFAILTTQPNALVGALHDRMPVIVPRSGFARWLSRDVGPAGLDDLVAPLDSELMEAWPVSPAVGNVRFDEPACREPLAPPR